MNEPYIQPSAMSVFFKSMFETIFTSLISILIGSIGVYILWAYFSNKYSLPPVSFVDCTAICAIGRLITGNK